MTKDRAQMLHEIRTYAGQSFDKQIVYLAGGGLVLTIGFIERIIPDLTKSEYTWFLYGTWIFFVLTLIANLLSHRCTTASIDYFISGEDAKGAKWNTLVSIANTSSVICLSIGTISFIVFIIKNVIQ